MEQTFPDLDWKKLATLRCGRSICSPRQMSATFWIHFGSMLAVFGLADLIVELTHLIRCFCYRVSFILAKNLQASIQIPFLIPSTLYFVSNPYLYTYVVCVLTWSLTSEEMYVEFSAIFHPNGQMARFGRKYFRQVSFRTNSYFTWLKRKKEKVISPTPLGRRDSPSLRISSVVHTYMQLQ